MYGFIRKFSNIIVRCIRCPGRPADRTLRIFRRIIVGLMIVLFQSAGAAEYIRFGTGGNGGTYLPIGSLIANAINQRGITTHDQQELVVLPQRSNGSVANLIDISAGLLEVALAQADSVSYVYQGKSPVDADTAKQKPVSYTHLTLPTIYSV